MPNPTVLVQGLSRPAAMRSRSASGTLLVALGRGDLISVDITTGQRSPVASIRRIAAFDVSADGQTAYVGRVLQGLWRVPLDGAPPRLLARGFGRPGAVVFDSAANTVLLAEGRAPGRLLAFTLEPPQMSVKAAGLKTVRGLVLERAAGRMIAAEAAGGGRLVIVQPDGSITVLAEGLGSPVDLAWRDESQTHLLVADAAGGRILQVDIAQPAVAPVELYAGLSDLWAAQPIDANRFAIGAGDSLLIAELLPIERAPLEMRVPSAELFISGWVHVELVLNDPTLAIEDIEFEVTPTGSGALVSRSRDNSFDPAHPTVLLSAGWMTGEHTLVARHRSSGDELGRTVFTVLDHWSDSTAGPSIATFGSVISGPDSGTWGGPDGGDFTVPQNVEVHKAVGTRNIAVVLVSTANANAQFPTGAALNTLIDTYRNEIVNGVAIGGETRSVVRYFSEASHGALSINLVGIIGPITLPNNWSSYFTLTDGRWVPNEDLDSTIIAQIVAQNKTASLAGNPPVLDLSQLDSIIYVIKSRVSPPDADLSVWPRASLSTKVHTIGTMPIVPLGLEVPILRGIARIWMPDDWTARDAAGTNPGNRQFHETICHELLHNLGLIDQYNKSYAADIADRITGGPQIAVDNPTGAASGTWELMAWERALPLPSAAHRLMLGWIRKEHVRLYNFGVFGPIDERLVLHAAADWSPPAGEFAAAEVRLEDGKNFYFEYRPTVDNRIADNNPPDASAVVATEALTRTPEPTDRAQILLVDEDADLIVEAGSFRTGEDYRDRDTTTAGFEQDFIVDVVGTTDTTAEIRVRYAPDAKPDPGITPWSPNSNWQSPDLEVVNGRSLAEPAFRNIPWEGHDNRLLARVTNRGTSDAHQVKVKFFYKDFTFGAGTEMPLGEQTLDIPASTTVTFTSPGIWKPEQLQLLFGRFTYEYHACLVARIDPFLDPVSNIWEVTPENNEATSNYTWIASSTSSPASREVTTILAENPFDKPAIISFIIRQPHPLFRVYLDHRWVRLEPGEQRRILLMVESLLGDPNYAPLVGDFRHNERRIETTLRLSAYGDTGETCAPSLIGGVSVLGMTGLGTHFEWFETEGGLARGFVVQTDTGIGVSGKVLVSVQPVDPDRDVPELIREAEVSGGEFRVEHGRAEGGWRFQAHYLGRFPWMPSDSRVIET